MNDPWQAESICRDILSIDPDNQQALVTLILCITDQFSDKFRTNISQAMKLIAELKDEYQQQYYKGLIYERQATAALNRANPRSGYIAYEHLMKAMDCYESAERIRPDEDEESILRWNACARIIERHKLERAPDEKDQQPFLDV